MKHLVNLQCKSVESKKRKPVPINKTSTIGRICIITSYHTLNKYEEIITSLFLLCAVEKRIDERDFYDTNLASKTDLSCFHGNYNSTECTLLHFALYVL